MIKRTIMAFLLVICMLPTVCTAYAEDNYSDYEKKAALLIALGADISDDVEPSKEMNRIIFVKNVVAMYGYENLAAMSEGRYFKDVDKNSESGMAVNAAVSMGLVEYDESRMFRPTENITYGEAVKVVMAALGYSKVAKYSGGFETGYLKYANDCKVTNGVNSENSKMTYGNAVRLIYNMLRTDVLIENYEAGRTNYETAKEFMTHYRGLSYTKGRVTANDLTGIYDANSAGKNNIIMNGESYLVGDTTVSDMLGYETELYFDEDKQIVHAATTGTDELTRVSPTNRAEFKTDKIEYIENGKIKTIKVDINSSVIYNRVYAGTVRSVDFKALVASAYSVDVIKTKNNEQYFFVNVYNTYAFESYNESNKTIYGKYDKAYKIPNNADEVIITNLYSGKRIDMSSVQEWNILDVMEVNANGRTVLYITVSDYYVKGRLTAISDTNGITQYSIDGTLYDVSPSLLNCGEELPKMGERAVYYCDSLGRLAVVDYSPVNYYAYLCSGYTDETGENSYVELYTSKGEFVTMPLGEKIKLNGSSYNANVVLEALKDSSNKVKRQLVIYDSNGKGEVTEIQTATDRHAEENYIGYDEDNFTLDRVTQTDAYVFRNYIRQFSTIKETFSFASDCVLFDIPPTNNKKKFTVKSIKEYTTQGSIPEGTKFYDFGEDICAKVAVVERSAELGGAVREDGKTGMVDKVSVCVNEDDELQYKLKFVGRTEEVVLLMDAEYDSKKNYGYGVVDAENLKFGDFIQYDTNTSGEITIYKVLFRCSEPDSFYSGDKVGWDGLLTFYGNVVTAAGDGQNRTFSMSMELKNTDDTPIEVVSPFMYDLVMAKNYNPDGANVFVYDSDSNTISLSDGMAIRKGEKVWARMYYGFGQIFIVVK